MMGFEFNLGEWTILLFRVLHIVTAIAWIGASFYFVWLDMNLRPVPEAKHGKGLHGDLWAIHGGGIYEVQIGPALSSRPSTSKATKAAQTHASCLGQASDHS